MLFLLIFSSSSHLLYQRGLEYRGIAARVQQEGAGEVKFMLTLDTLKKTLNLTVFMLFLEILYHICINSMKSCIIIYQKSVVSQGFWEFIESRRKIRVWVFLACLACLTVQYHEMCVLIPVHLDTNIFTMHFFFFFNNLYRIIFRKLLFGLAVGFICLFRLFGMVCPSPVQMLLRCFLPVFEWWKYFSFFYLMPPIYLHSFTVKLSEGLKV